MAANDDAARAVKRRGIRAAGGFGVQVMSGAGKAAGGTDGATGTLCWRVVAKPKTEANIGRLAEARLAPKMDLTNVPKPPAPPTASSLPKKP